MNLKRHISILGSRLKTKRKKMLNKRGVYILEASVIIPIFLVVMVALISVIPVIAAAENTLFALGDELRKANVRAAFIEGDISLPILAEGRVLAENSSVDSVWITDIRILEDGPIMDDVMAIKMRLNYSKNSIFGSLGALRIEQGAMSRAFTGKDRRGETGVGSGDEYHGVYVFPNHGVRYHNKSCPFLNPACEKVLLTHGVKSMFKSCKNCGSGSASLGSQVFCFFNDGKVYHLGNCSAVDKFYVEMDKKDAISRGYSPCGSCGG